MEKETQEILQQVLQYFETDIDNDDWDKVINTFDDVVREICTDDNYVYALSVTQFVKFIMDAGVDFLPHMSTIPYELFYGLDLGNRDLIIPANIDQVNGRAFVGMKCRRLIFNCKSAAIETSLSICEDLVANEVILPSDMTVLKKGMFCYAEIQKLDISNIEEIEYEMFYNSNIKSFDNFVGSPKLTKIGEDAFTRCHNIQSVDLSKCENLTLIDEGAFAACQGLKEVYLPDIALNDIGTRAFANFKGKIIVAGPYKNYDEYILQDIAEKETIWVFTDVTIKGTGEKL